MERFTEEIKGKYSIKANDVEMYITENVATGEKRFIGKAVDALAAYEIAEEQGRLLPDGYRCEQTKNGLTIYCLDGDSPPQEVHIFQ